MKASYAIVIVPAAPVRKTPHHQREMSNQLLFGETVRILQNKNNQWLKIKSLYDGYCGWLTPHLVKPITANEALQPAQLLASERLTPIVLDNQPMYIPMASSLPTFRNKKGIIAQLPYTCGVKPISLQNDKNNKTKLLEHALHWLNAPYLWGGKTILGVDCSGFSQTMYKLIGCPIARDAWQQSQQGTIVASLQKVQPGDLAFFEENDKIMHVSILLNSKTIIHAAGKVRIDSIDKKGIINNETGVRTHQLKRIRRIIE